MKKFLKYSAAGLLAWTMMLSVSGFASTEATTSASQQGADLKRLVLPGHGVSEKYVTQKFGNPGSKEAAVGEPPISVWHYDRYSVYFEHDRVIHTVLIKK
jgi:hypothetical protein